MPLFPNDVFLNRLRIVSGEVSRLAVSQILLSSLSRLPLVSGIGSRIITTLLDISCR